MDKISAPTNGLECLIYTLARDHLPTGKLQEIYKKQIVAVDEPITVYSNGFLYQYAKDYADKIRAVGQKPKPIEFKDLKVWKINDAEWIFGPTFGKAIDAYLDIVGLGVDECFDGEPQLLLNEDLMRHKYFEGDSKTSFLEQLAKLHSQGETAGILATRDY